MNQLELKERLIKLKRDPMYQKIADIKTLIGFYNNKEICLHISDMILIIMNKIYHPLGLWGQNPNEPKKKDLGVVFDMSIWSLLHYREDRKGWGLINYANTNYYGWDIIFNFTHIMFIDYCKKMNITSLKIGDVEFSIYDDFTFNSNWINDIEGTKIKLRNLLRLTYFFAENIFNPECDLYFQLITLFRKTSGRGREAEELFETHITDFFNDIISYKKSAGDGDYKDRKEGVDLSVTTKTKSEELINVKSVGYIDDSDKNIFVINVGISETSKCDYIVFVLSDNSKIMMFENNKSKIIRNYNDNGMGFPVELLKKEMTYKK